MDQLFTYLAGSSAGVAYTIIFCVLVACGLGFPLPEDIPLAAAGYLIWNDTLSIAGGVLVTVGGVIAGDSMLYLLGRKFGARMLDPNREKPLFAPRRVNRVRAYFRKYGDKIVFFARFVAGLRAVVFFMAGALHMPYRRFVLFDGLAALLSVPIWLGIGYGLGHYFGHEINRILSEIHKFKHILGWVIGGLLFLFVLRIVYRYLRLKYAEKGNAGTSV
jgi:membrane protein DedA with SNARE-associated domain